MRKSDIQPGVEVYYAPGPYWRIVTPIRVVIVDAAPRRIVRRRSGPFTVVSHVPDPAGNAILVDMYEGARVRRIAVPVRDLRGLWRETLAATGRTEAGVKAHGALVHELATASRDITATDVLGLAARSEVLPDDVFVPLSQAVDGRPIEMANAQRVAEGK